MSSRTRLRAASVVLLVVGALVGFWLLRERATREDRAAEPQIDRAAGPDDSVVRPPLVLDEIAPERITLCEPGSPMGPPLEPPAEPWARVWLRGYVGAGRQSLEHSLVIVRAGPTQDRLRSARTAASAWSHLDASRRFEADISHLFQREADLHPEVVSLQLLLDDALPVEVDVEVPFDRDELARGGEIELRAVITLPVLCPLYGHARLADGSEAALLVAAFELTHSVPGPLPLAIAHLAPRDSAFRLEVPCDVEVVLVAFTDQYRPATKIIGTQRGAIDDLSVERGATLRGSIEPGPGPSDLAVFAEFVEFSSRMAHPEIAGTRLVWHEQAFDLASHSLRAQSDGTFEFVGLGPKSYRVRLAQDPTTDEYPPQVIVIAPADDVVVQRAPARDRNQR